MPTIRTLQSSDDRSRFRSGDVDLDRFLAKYAGQNQFRHHLGTTYVALGEAGDIVGYATISAGSVEIDQLPAVARKGLPSYPIPILRLARLAVDSRVQGQGVGSALLRFVLDLALRMRAQFGCLGVVVDAKSTAVAFYAAYGFGAIELVEGASGARPEPVAMFLPLRHVEAAKK